MFSITHYETNFTCQGEFVAQWLRQTIKKLTNLTNYTLMQCDIINRRCAKPRPVPVKTYNLFV